MRARCSARRCASGWPLRRLVWSAPSHRAPGLYWRVRGSRSAVPVNPPEAALKPPRQRSPQGGWRRAASPQLGGPNSNDAFVRTQLLVNPFSVHRASQRSVTGCAVVAGGDGDGQTIALFDGQTMLAGGLPSLFQVTW